MSLPLFTIMDRYSLPTSVEIDGVECKFNTDYRDILNRTPFLFGRGILLKRYGGILWT